MMALIAVVALGLVLAEEFRDGNPPRFVVRGIPRRIARLRPGMTWEQTREILGLERSWLTGGTDARFGSGDGYLDTMQVVYFVRPPRVVVRMGQMRGEAPAPMRILDSTAMIQLRFHRDVGSRGLDWRQDKATRLVWASFSSDSMKIAEMPESQ